MIVKRSGSKIFGMHMSKVEQQALDIEIRKSHVKEGKRYYNIYDAGMLYYCHTKYGHTAKWLREFWEGFNEFRKEMMEHYVLEEDDVGWVCMDKLKSIGVDVEKWNEENK